MANNKITQLNSLTSGSLSDEDLFVVVDRDDTASPTGDTKNITAGNLAGFISNLTGNGGATTETFGWQPAYNSIGFVVSQAVRLDSNSRLALADAKTSADAEAIGLISNIVNGTSIEVTFAGKVSFDSVIFEDSSGVLQVGSDFTKGVVYFLGEDGYLANVDRSEDNSGWISKPMFIATSETDGIVLSYRGLVNSISSTTNQPWEFIITDNGRFLVGDVIRRTKTNESIYDWDLASSDTAIKANAVGVVKEITYGVDSSGSADNRVKVATMGYISGLSGLSPGETYYLTATVANSSLGLDGIDVTRTSRRNVTTNGPSCPYFSRPIYIAISTTEAVIVNQRTLPNPTLVSSACDESTAGSFKGTFQYNRNTTPDSPSGYAQSTISPFLSFVISDAVSNDTADVFWIDPVTPSNKYKWRSTYLNGSWTNTTQTYP